MDRSLDSLSSSFRPKACELIARLASLGIPVMIIQTGRTPEEQLANLQNGTSAVSISKHEARRLRGLAQGGPDDEKADAIDLCPYAQFTLHGPDKLQWDSSDAAFTTIMLEAEKLGLRSGGRWKSPHDPGHVELLFPGERHQDIPSSSAAYAEYGVHA